MAVGNFEGSELSLLEEVVSAVPFISFSNPNPYALRVRALWALLMTLVRGHFAGIGHLDFFDPPNLLSFLPCLSSSTSPLEPVVLLPLTLPPIIGEISTSIM